MRIQVQMTAEAVMAQEFPGTVVPRLLRFSNGKRVGYMDLSGPILIPPTFDDANNSYKGKVAARLNGRWGYLDHTGTWAIQPLYEQLSLIWYLPLTAKLNGWWGLLDDQGQSVVEPIYEQLRMANEAFEFRQDQKWGAISRSGQILIPPVFDEINSSPTSSHSLYASEALGISDRSGMIGSAEYVRVIVYDEGLPVVQRGNQQEMIEVPTEKALPLRHDAIYPTQHRQRWIVPDGRYDGSDRPESDLKQEHALIRRNDANRREVSNARLRALTTIDGKFLTEFIVQQIGEFNDGLAPAKIEGKWGFIDAKGGMVIEARFSYAYPFLQGLAPVSIDKKYGYIDKTDAFVIRPRFEEAQGFLPDGIATAKLDGQYIYIDRDGRKIAQPASCRRCPTADLYLQLNARGLPAPLIS